MVISTRGLCKTYSNGIKGLSDLDLEIRAGEIFGLLGPNGSGKSTTVRLLNGTLTPTAGSVQVLGSTAGDEQIRKATATVAESALLYEHMTVDGNLQFFARLYDIDPDTARARADLLLGELGLDDRKSDRFGSLSTGLRKRVQLARALLHRPKILYLDEPTSGLDPDSARQVVDMVQTLATGEGTTVLLCTHNLPLAEQVCTRYGFLVEGRMVWSGSRTELRDAVMTERVVQVTSDRGVETHPIASDAAINGVVRSVMDSGAHITDVRTLEPSLEEAYFRIVARASEGGSDESLAS